MADFEQKIKIKEIADVKEVLKGIDDIQKALGKLAVDPGTQASFNRLFDNIERQTEKANKAISSGFKNKSDVKNYSDAMHQIISSYESLIKNIEILKAKGTPLANEGDIFKQLGNQIDDLEKKYNKLQNTATKAAESFVANQQKLFDGMKAATSSPDFQEKQWKKLRDNFSETYVDIDKAKEALVSLRKAYDSANTDGKNADKWKLYLESLTAAEKHVKDYEQALEKKNNAESNAQVAYQDLVNAQTLYNEVVAKGAVELDKAGDAARTDAQNFRAYAKETGASAEQTQQLNSELEHFKGKAAYFFGISNAINLFKRAVRSAYNTVKDLDAVMTETAVVTNFDVGDMWDQLPEYTQRANELGVTIHSAYEAATIFYQQGLKTNEVMAVSNETLKMARIAGLDAATASDRMTNALRGFNMEMDKVNAQRVNDVYSKLAAITASDTDEISTAMTKVASLAHNANMEFETTAAFLAQIIESTRESAETAGTALKTVVARFSEVKKLYSKGELLGQDEEGEEIDVNRVSTALRSAGIDLNEYLTGAKGLDDIFIELAEKWDSLDQVQQRYIATMAAGSRQQSRFIALMSDYKRTIELVDAANNANGASQEQYGKTLESLQTKLARLRNAWDEFILGLANSDVIKGAVDLLTGLITAINDLIKAISGKSSAAKMITTFLTAFTGFKIGAKLAGKTPLGGFFKSLTTTANGEAAVGARAIAQTFYSNLANNLVNNRGSFKSSFKSGFANAKNFFSPVTEEMYAALDKEAHLTELYNSGKLSEAGLDHIQQQFLSGKTTIGEFNKSLRDAGIQYQITEEEAAKLGIVMKNDNSIIRSAVTDWRTFATVSMAAGSAMLFFGNMLEQSDDELTQNFGRALKVAGGALTVFGTIMSVTLPLQAQIGAKGVTAAINSIPIVGWVTLAISLITALGVALYSIAKNNSAQVVAEKAAEAAKEAADAANEAKEAYEKLGEAWDSLDDKYEVIESATKGTKEWRDAVREVNTAVLELLDLYSDIEVYRDEDGVLQIKNREEVDNRLEEASLYADANARLARIDALNKEQDARYEKDVNPFGGAQPYKDVVDTLQAQGKLGLATDEEIKALLQADFEQKQNGLNPEEYIDEVKAYGKEYLQNQIAVDTQQTIFKGIALDMANLDSDLEKYANNVADAINVSEIQERRLQIASQYETSDLENKYAKARGYTDFEDYRTNNPDEKVNAAEMIQYVAAAEAVDEVADKLNVVVDNLDTDMEKALFAGPNGSGLTRQQLDELLLKNYDRNALYTGLGGKEAFGSYEIFEEWFENTLISAIDSFDTRRFTQTFLDILDTGFGNFTGQLTSGTFKTFTDNLWSVYLISGKEGVDKIQSSFSKMTEGMSEEEIAKFVSSINEVNWASIDSIKALDDLAEEYGISEEEIEDFKKQIIEFNNAAANIDLDKLTSVLGLLKRIDSGEQGRSFTEEDYKNLIAHGVSDKDFQYNVETGNYDYIGQNLQDIENSVRGYLNTATDVLEKDVAANEFTKEYGEVNTDNQNDLGKFLSAYANATGDEALIDWSTVQQGSLEQYQAAYDMIMEAASRGDEELLNQIKQRNYQSNTGEENAALVASGDEFAVDALKQQITTSGLSEAIIQALLEDVESGDVDKIKSAGSAVSAVKDASEYGIEAEELEQYAEALRTVDGLEKLNEGTLITLAAANAKYQEGFKSVIESYGDWIELKQEDGSISADPTNLAEMEAINDLKKNLKEMFNLSEDVSDEFLEMPGIADLLERAVNGDTDAVSELRKELAKAQAQASLIELGIDSESQDAIFNAIDDMMEEAGTLEFGATLDQSQFAQGLLEAMQAAGMTVGQMQEMLNSLGWAPELDYEEIDVADAQKYSIDGEVEIADPANPGGTIVVPTHTVQDYASDGKVLIPRIGNATFVKPSMPDVAPSSSSGGGGGGGGSEKKPSYWENPYDELYNLQEKINEALRTREALERRYQKLLKEEKATLSDIRKAYYSQINNLRAEADLQKQFAAGRLRQIQNIGEQMYTDSEGDRSSFNSWGVTKYASYDANTGLIQIDWNGLEEIANDSDREEEGKAAEAYISKLEELTSSYEEVRDKLWDIEDEIESLREAAIESYLSFEDRVLEALVNSYQQQIDSYQAMSDSLEKASNEVLTSLREQVELSRQIRDNTDKEKQIADMENRLAYLQRDTSGSNALEIQKLQKDLEDARESYTDTLVDQAIEKMQNEADLAAEQRARQIETMQEQLEIMKETGALWQQVYDLMDEAAAGNGALSPKTTLVELLKDTEAFESLSNIGQAKWWSEVAEEFHAAWVGRDEAEDKYKTDANNDGIIANSGTSAAIDSVSATATSVSPTSSATSSSSGPSDADEAGVAMNICGPNNGWGDGETRRNRLEEKGFDYWSVQSIVNDIVNSGWDDSYYRRKYGISDLSDYSYYAFKTGGLADFTGPAWLDGTKAKPELILNAQDSANFIALKDILASLLNVQGGGLNGTKNGDNYFDIDISANIGSDYDVDRLAERLKQNIYNDGQYRNVNTINFLR